MKAVVQRWLEALTARRVPVRLLARTETLQETLEVVSRPTGRRHAQRVGRLRAGAGVGPVLASPVTRSPITSPGAARMSPSTSTPGSSAPGPERPDENVEYYQAKVLEIWERFRPFVDSEGLRPYSGEPESVDDRQLSLF